jgi:hypothetical protein
MVIYFTYSADCCESTREYFDKFDNSVKELKEVFNEEAKFIKADIAVEESSEKESIQRLARQYDLKEAPILLELLKDGELCV